MFPLHTLLSVLLVSYIVEIYIEEYKLKFIVIKTVNIKNYIRDEVQSWSLFVDACCISSQNHESSFFNLRIQRPRNKIYSLLIVVCGSECEISWFKYYNESFSKKNEEGIIWFSIC
jgi:hypothetical protein